MFKLDASAVAVRVEGEVVTHSEGNRTVRPEGDVSEQSPTVRPEGAAVTRSKGERLGKTATAPRRQGREQRRRVAGVLISSTPKPKPTLGHYRLGLDFSESVTGRADSCD